jgi:hypothetical protein
LLSHLDPASALAVGLLIFALLLVMAFEATNGFMMRPTPLRPLFTQSR